MFFQRNGRTAFAACMVGLIGLLAGAPNTAALTGSGESPLFSLNTLAVTAVDDQTVLPRLDRLVGNVPNPFNPTTTINFEVAQPTAVELKIYDLQGHLVKVLLGNEPFAAGVHQTEWDGRDDRGSQVAAGVYLYRLVTESFSGSQRMTLVK